MPPGALICCVPLNTQLPVPGVEPDQVKVVNPLIVEEVELQGGAVERPVVRKEWVRQGEPLQVPLALGA